MGSPNNLLLSTLLMPFRNFQPDDLIYEGSSAPCQAENLLEHFHADLQCHMFRLLLCRAVTALEHPSDPFPDLQSLWQPLFLLMGLQTLAFTASLFFTSCAQGSLLACPSVALHPGLS